MSRPIKFRGLTIDPYEAKLNTWKIGYYKHNDCELNPQASIMVFDEKAGWTPYRVNPKTVGQFTGSQDIKDVDIYEGDTFKSQVCLSPDGVSSAHNQFYWIDVLCVVTFIEGSFVGKWEIKDKKQFDCTFNRFGYEALTMPLIIGNIHQNPEFMEVE